MKQPHKPCYSQGPTHTNKRKLEREILTADHPSIKVVNDLILTRQWRMTNLFSRRANETVHTYYLAWVYPNSMSCQQIVFQELDFFKICNCPMINPTIVCHVLVLVGYLCNMLDAKWWTLICQNSTCCKIYTQVTNSSNFQDERPVVENSQN